MSEGTVELVLGGIELERKAVARLQPCWAKRSSTVACGRE